ncbi:retron St85 family effector protein [Agrobacterium sp. LMR679]|uniref:retron St85 family effector protein n=1 Tax=Agrobacterium sp. LMR679 TaxID=3014335 RepID=UPI0022AF93AA|nr:retron St85 family effector protein [Agrobacterium sp. LMR679]MCZ4074945.1 retron St85 family effector protein [Agrobacterium sp. LMR679]
MHTEASDPRLKFIKYIDIDEARVLLEPRLLFICGGPVDVKSISNHSVRNMFMNSAGEELEDIEGFVLAENYKDWSTGYHNLSEFENDIAYISSLVVIFLESEGALAEFGLFFANERLRPKLVAVVHDEFHRADSFIKFGLLDPMEKDDEESVRVYSIDHRDINSVTKKEVKDILIDVTDHASRKIKSEKFDRKNRGHYIFLIFQIVDLFASLTKGEIVKFLDILQFSSLKKDIDSALYILKKFNLIDIKRNLHNISIIFLATDRKGSISILKMAKNGMTITL